MSLIYSPICRLALLIILALACSPAAAQQDFGKLYDPDGAMILYGRIERMDFTVKSPNGRPAPVLWVRASGTTPQAGAAITPNTHLWRVEGGNLMLTPETKPLILLGAEVTVRGHNARDTRCAGGCRMAGRDVTFLADSCRVIITTGERGAAPPKNYRCPDRARALGLEPYREEWGYSP